MPRKSRIDAAGALHHVIARGIERRVIFRDDYDRDLFLDRLGVILDQTKTHCYAFALIPNHFHLLLRTGLAPLAQVMRRLLTAYAIRHNRRHKRSGHLFQNRYKSILCQEESYFLELVRYIHLNPLRAGIVAMTEGLEEFRYCDHGPILGRHANSWQDVDGVLRLFAGETSLARTAYLRFVEEGATAGRRDDLVGGGLIRSSGGWTNVLAMRRDNLFRKSDERILGDGDFVDRVLSEAQERMERRYHLKAMGFDMESVADHVCRLLTIDREELFTPGKEPAKVVARSLFCYFAVNELGTSQSELSYHLDLSAAAVSMAVKRGQKLVKERGYRFP
jgi:REP element-mobilizing transposase RayT